MGTVGVGSSVWEQLELGAVLWKQMEQEAINGNSGNKVHSVYGNSWNMEQCTVYILGFIHRLVSNFPNVFVPIDMETKKFSLVDFEFVFLHPYLQHKNTGQTYTPFHTKKYMYRINILTK